VSATALEGIGADLSNVDKQAKLAKQGIKVVNKETGKLRSYLEITKEIKAVTERKGNQFWLSEIFGETGLRGVRALMDYGEDFQKRVAAMGDTTGSLETRAGTMAGTLQSNIKNLQTAFGKFADTNLAKPLEHITGLLNKMAEDPKRFEAVFNAIKRGVLIIGGLKIGAGVMSFLSTIRDFKGGDSKVKITETLSAAQAMPVYVTNWGGASGPIGAAGISGARTGGLVDQYGNPLSSPAAPITQPPAAPVTPPATPKNKWKLNKPNMKGALKAGAGAAAITAALALPDMVSELGEISKNEELTTEERGKAKGGAIGEFAGSIGGAAAGAIAGAAIGSVVPVVGTALGALVGGLVGQFGGPVGRFIGEKIGAAVSKEKSESEQTFSAQTQNEGYDPMLSTQPEYLYSEYLPPEVTRTGTGITPQKVELEGQAVMDVNVTLTDERVTAEAAVRNNGIDHMSFNTNNPGHAPLARRLYS
jgi:hypothetical protein